MLQNGWHPEQEIAKRETGIVHALRDIVAPAAGSVRFRSGRDSLFQFGRILLEFTQDLGVQLRVALGCPDRQSAQNHQNRWQQYEDNCPLPQALGRGASEQQHHHESRQRIDQQNVAGPDQQHVSGTEGQQNQQPAQVQPPEGCLARFGAFQHQGKAGPEQHGEQGVKLAFGQCPDQPVRGGINAGGAGINPQHHGLDGPGEPLEIDQQNAQQREAAQDIQMFQALPDRADG